MSINNRLREVYMENWSGLIEHGSKITGPVAANPMLLSFNEKSYAEADMRVMICGQETWGWDNFGASIETSMAKYDRFFIQQEFYSGYGISAYWKAFRFFESKLRGFYQGQNIQFIYQNLSKIGRNDGKTGVTDQIRSLERQHFPVFKQELQILRPDFVLFLTGPNRDHDIRFHYPDLVFSHAGDERILRKRAWVTSSELPCAALRLYHPNYFKAWSNCYKSEALALITQIHQCKTKP